jgi:filamentous hemagglutinin family protein
MTFASPTGGSVTSGSATINQSGSTTTINQSSNKASINWQSFNIAPSETVNFVQPSASSVTLNRVVGASSSLIQGAMNANGQVILVNPNGVVFTQGSSVNVGGLVATTKNITDANFQAGNYTFEGNSDASILNMGTIHAANGGYVAMMAKTVQNQGTITANLGHIELAGGNKFTLNLNGNSLLNLTIDEGTLNTLVENGGLIKADGGVIHLTTKALDSILSGMVNNTGVIEAQSLNNQNGEIILFAHGGTANVGGTLKAEGGFIETSGQEFAIQIGRAHV